MKRQRTCLCIQWISALSALFLLTGLSLGRGDLPSSQARIQPRLQQLALAQPGTQVSVIVQKSVSGERVERLTERLGGAVTKDLHIINAFAAELPAAAATELAKDDGVRWVSLDTLVANAGGLDGTISSAALISAYDKSIGADKVWAQGYQGSSVTVAVVDSGWTDHEDFRATPSGGSMRLLTRVGFNGNETNLDDNYGHGDHVMGIIGGNGRQSNGQYIGVAPKVKLVSVKVSDGSGQSNTSGLVQGLQWVFDNRLLYNIRVVNLSLNSTVDESYHTSPLDAALEILWLNSVVVVVSAGNNGTTDAGVVYPPANDPFVIAVGAVDDKGNTTVSNDVLAGYSAYGTTSDGFAKPDIMAPGSNIIAPLSSSGAELAMAHPDHVVSNTSYFRMSGTSMAAAVTSGAIALLLQAAPTLSPDQVKYRLLNTPSRTVRNGDRSVPYLNVYNAVSGTTTQSSNSGLYLSHLLQSGIQPVVLNSVSWDSVSWNSVSWNSVSWNSVSWNSVSWNSEYWGP
jgi:serine protease AprX